LWVHTVFPWNMKIGIVSWRNLTISLVECAIVVAVSERIGANPYSTVTDFAKLRG
jgi:hypothetical protein